jgi:RND family efflux transporter MFP subunit
MKCSLSPLMVVLAAAIPVCASGQQADTPRPRVTIAAAVVEDVALAAEFIGRGEAVDAVDLVARVEGYVEEIAVGDGTAVEQGDLLLRIESDGYEAALAARRADLARAQANLDLASIERVRTEELVARDTVPASQLDTVSANERVAEADVKAAEAAIRQAELNVGYTEIHAPFDGRVGQVAASLGELVGPSTGPLVALVRQAPMHVVFSVSEPQFLNLLEHVGDGVGRRESADRPLVRLVLPNGTVLEEVGEVVFVDNRIDPATGTMSVWAEFANERGLILDGAFLTVRIEAAEPTPSVLIPQGAVQRDQKGAFVLVVTDQQTVEQRYVILGETLGTQIVVEDGLREGESIIVEGLQQVRPGITVDAVLAGQPIEE